MTYGDHAKQARRRADFSIQDLSKRAGVLEETIRRIEQGVRLSRIDTVSNIAEALGIGIDEYFGIQPRHYFWEERTGDICEHIIAQRRAQFLTVERLALMAEVSPVTLRDIESGKTTRPLTTTVLMLAAALNLSPDEYLGNPCPARRSRV